MGKMFSKTIKEAYLQAAKELRRHLGSGEYRLLKPEKAFIQWYIFAQFGKKIGDQDVAIVDSPGENGIDAIVSTERETFVLQMKYEVVPRISYVSQNDVKDFEKLSRIFRDEFPDIKFSDWLNDVRPQIKNRYKHIHDMLRRDPKSIRFVFVTSKLCSLDLGDMIEIESAPNILSLWDLYRDGFTPPTESIEIKLSDNWSIDTERFRTYVGLADALDFLKIMEDDKNERLFAQNVRTDLRSKINIAVRETYEKEPEKFWLGNNGIYIVCKRVIQEGKTFKLFYPSIINGSQTLHAIAASDERHSCKILVRILQMDVTGDQKLLGEIIRRTNTQNPMKLVNLAAHDPYQLNIARYLDKYKIFYERREKEWKNEKKDLLTDFIHINIQELGQWLSLLHKDIGFGTARAQVHELFQEKYYEEIFQCFDRELTSPLYNDMVLIVWSALLYWEVIYEFNKKQRLAARIVQFLLIRSIYDAITSDKKIKDKIPRMLEQHQFGHKKIPFKLISLIKKVILDLRKIQKKEQSREETVDFSNFYKRNNLTADAYKKICRRKYSSSLSRVLSLVINKIE